MHQMNRTPALAGDRGSEMRLAERLDGSEHSKSRIANHQFQFSADQDVAIRACSDHIRQQASFNSSDQVGALLGPAGTGKTLIESEVIARSGMAPLFFDADRNKWCGDLAICATTAKAANVLQRRVPPGVKVITAHKATYAAEEIDGPNTPILRSKLDELTRTLEAVPKTDKAERKRLQKAIHLARKSWRNSRRVKFLPSEKAPINVVKAAIIDEASMMGSAMLKDALSSGTKILLTGDPHQLPPVQDEAVLTTVQKVAVLRTMHRNGGGVLELATMIREGKPIPCPWVSDDGTARVVRANPEIEHADAWDAFIVGTNNYRRQWNNMRRVYLGHSAISGLAPSGPSERLVCKANMHDLDLSNNQAVRLDDIVIDEDGVLATVTPLDDNWLAIGDPIAGMAIDMQMIEAHANPNAKQQQVRPADGHILVDYAYALTCHTAQGSEWPHVAVLAHGWGTDDRRWLYTAVSRARKSVTVFAPSGLRLK